MKKHGFRSIFSLLLAVMMVCSMLPTAAFAEGDVEEQSVVGEPVGTPAEEPKQDEVKPPEGGTPEEPKQDEVKQPEGETPEEPKQPEGETPEEPKQPEGGTSQGPAKPADAAQWDAVVPGGSVLTEPSISEPDVDLTALNTGHKIDVTFTVLYVGDEFRIGYSYGSSEKTKFVCQYTTNHGDSAYSNHTIAISDIKAAAGRASVNSGYQIVGWSKEANGNPTTWSLNKSGTTACNKGTTIYLVAKNPNPTTERTFILKFDVNGGTGTFADVTRQSSAQYEMLQIPSNYVPTRKGYTFKGWKDTYWGSTYQVGASVNVNRTDEACTVTDTSCTKTLSAVWEKNAPSGPASGKVAELLGQVTVQCTTPIAGHEDQTYDLYYALSSMVMAPDGSGYTCDVRVEADDYVTKYNRNYPGTDHVLADGENRIRSFVLRNDNDGKGWYISEGKDLLPIVFNVKCEAPTPPSVPTDKEIAKALEGRVNVVVSCVTANSGHPSERYPLFAYVSGLTKPNPNEVTANSDGTYSYTVSFLASNFVKMYSGAAPFGIGSDHELADTQDLRTVTLTLRDSTVGWTATTQNIDVSAKCEEQQPEGPSEITDGDLEALLKGALKIECTEVEGHVKLYDVKKEDVRRKNVSGFNAEITFDAIPYFGEFIGEFGQHSSAAGESYTKVITLKWVDGKWVATNTPIIHKVVCVPEIDPPKEPKKPGAEDLANLKAPVDVTCTTKPETHAAVHFSLRGGTYTIGDVAGNETDGYTCDITVTADKYVARYNMDYGKHTLTGDNTKTLTLKYVEGRWAVDTPITFPVECETAPQKPDKPTNEIGGATVAVKCITGHGDLSWEIGSSTFTVGEVTGDDTTGYTCTVTVQAEVYVNAFNSDKKANGVKHTLADDAEKTFTMTYVNGAWTGPTNPAVTFEVKCETEQPEEPDAPDISTLQVNVHCKTLSDVHGDGWYYLPEGTTPERINGYTYQVAIPAKPYVDKYNETHPGHKLADEVSKTITITWDGDLMRWNYSTSVVTFDVKCKPDAPKAEDLWLSVVIHCKSDVHNDGLYDLTDDTFTVGEVEGNEADGYTCKVTVKAAQYVNKYVGEMKVNHDIVGEDTKTVTLKYESAFERWTVDSTVVTFDVECIPAPNISMLQVQVHCVTPNSSHMDEFYDLPEDTTLEYVNANTRKITVQAAPYVEQYGNGHKLADGESESKTITATWNGVKWNFDATSVTFDVKCTTQEGPDAPTAEQVASLLKVKVSCANLSAAHQENMPAFVYQPLLPGSFGIGEVTGNAQSGYACRITVRAARYVQDFNTRSNAMHAPTDGTEKAVTLYYEDGGWTVGTGSGLVEFTVICENVPAQKYTVTYTDGVDGVEIFKDQVYADLTAGTATPAFNGTPTRVGYFFAGWNPAVTATVTGNVTYTATWKVDSNNNGKPDDEEERYTVTYLDGANGKAFASQVYPGLLSGTATPKFNGTPVRSGYVFIGWSPVWSGTVTGNVTYTATWSTITGGLDKVPKTGDSGLALALSALLLFSFCGAAACVVSTKKRG